MARDAFLGFFEMQITPNRNGEDGSIEANLNLGSNLGIPAFLSFYPDMTPVVKPFREYINKLRMKYKKEEIKQNQTKDDRSQEENDRLERERKDRLFLHETMAKTLSAFVSCLYCEDHNIAFQAFECFKVLAKKEIPAPLMNIFIPTVCDAIPCFLVSMPYTSLQQVYVFLLFLFRQFLPVLYPSTVVRLLEICFLPHGEVQLGQLLISDILGLLSRQCSIATGSKKHIFSGADNPMSSTQFCMMTLLNLVEDVQYIKDFDKLLLQFFNPNARRTIVLNNVLEAHNFLILSKKQATNMDRKVSEKNQSQLNDANPKNLPKSIAIVQIIAKKKIENTHRIKAIQMESEQKIQELKAKQYAMMIEAAAQRDAENKDDGSTQVRLTVDQGSLEFNPQEEENIVETGTLERNERINTITRVVPKKPRSFKVTRAGTGKKQGIEMTVLIRLQFSKNTITFTHIRKGRKHVQAYKRQDLVTARPLENNERELLLEFGKAKPMKKKFKFDNKKERDDFIDLIVHSFPLPKGHTRIGSNKTLPLTRSKLLEFEKIIDGENSSQYGSIPEESALTPTSESYRDTSFCTHLTESGSGDDDDGLIDPTPSILLSATSRGEGEGRNSIAPPPPITHLSDACHQINVEKLREMLVGILMVLCKFALVPSHLTSIRAPNDPSEEDIQLPRSQTIIKDRGLTLLLHVLSSIPYEIMLPTNRPQETPEITVLKRMLFPALASTMTSTDSIFTRFTHLFTILWTHFLPSFFPQLGILINDGMVGLFKSDFFLLKRKQNFLILVFQTIFLNETSIQSIFYNFDFRDDMPNLVFNLVTSIAWLCLKPDLVEPMDSKKRNPPELQLRLQSTELLIHLIKQMEGWSREVQPTFPLLQVSSPSHNRGFSLKSSTSLPSINVSSLFQNQDRASSTDFTITPTGSGPGFRATSPNSNHRQKNSASSISDILGSGQRDSLSPKASMKKNIGHYRARSVKLFKPTWTQDFTVEATALQLYEADGKKLKSALKYLNRIYENEPPTSREFPRIVADFFWKHQDRLDKAQIGDVLGGLDGGVFEPRQYDHLRDCFISNLEFTGLPFEAALRVFLIDGGFRLPGEAQKISRIVESFCKHYCIQNSNNIFKNTDSAFVVAFAMIMLNTDLHDTRRGGTKKKAHKMTQKEFINNLRGMNDGENFPVEFLKQNYQNIQAEGIEWKQQYEEKKDEIEIDIGKEKEIESKNDRDKKAFFRSLIIRVQGSLRRDAVHTRKMQQLPLNDNNIGIHVSHLVLSRFLMVVKHGLKSNKVSYLELLLDGLTSSATLINSSNMKVIRSLAKRVQQRLELLGIRSMISNESHLEKNRRIRRINHSKCIIGSELVSWFIVTQRMERSYAVKLGQTLFAVGLVSIDGFSEFQDSDKHYYKFQKTNKILGSNSETQKALEVNNISRNSSIAARESIT